MENRTKARLACVEKTKKDLIELRSRIWERMSDAQKEQYYRDKVDNDISIKNIISFFNEHSDRIEKEIGNPDFEALFDKRWRMKITCFDNFWKELDNERRIHVNFWEELDNERQIHVNFWEELDNERQIHVEDYIHVPIKPEVARSLLKDHGKDWCVMRDFNDFYHCLKGTLKDFDDMNLKKKSEF